MRLVIDDEIKGWYDIIYPLLNTALGVTFPGRDGIAYVLHTSSNEMINYGKFKTYSLLG